MCGMTRLYNGKYVIEFNLHREWFDMILALIKKEEYRNLDSAKFKRQFKRFSDGWRVKIPYKKDYAKPSECVILFCNGYGSDRDQFYIEFKSLCVSTGNPEWGAVNGEQYFTLGLGEIFDKRLKINN